MILEMGRLLIKPVFAISLLLEFTLFFLHASHFLVSGNLFHSQNGGIGIFKMQVLPIFSPSKICSKT